MSLATVHDITAKEPNTSALQSQVSININIVFGHLTFTISRTKAIQFHRLRQGHLTAEDQVKFHRLAAILHYQPEM